MYFSDWILINKEGESTRFISLFKPLLGSAMLVRCVDYKKVTATLTGTRLAHFYFYFYRIAVILHSVSFLTNAKKWWHKCCSFVIPLITYPVSHNPFTLSQSFEIQMGEQLKKWSRHFIRLSIRLTNFSY